jgi:hypothetical protein
LGDTMNIKESQSKNLILQRVRNQLRYKTVAALFIFIVYSGILIMFAGVLYREGFFGQVLKPAIETNISIPFNYIQGMMSTPEHITIDIKHKDYQYLAYKRKIALEEGMLHKVRTDLVEKNSDWVPGQLRWNGKTVKIELKLKGNFPWHWSDDHKWSFKVKVKGGNTVLGMKAFALMHPKTRGYLVDWYLQQLLKDYCDLMTIRLDFVELTVNGRDYGVYLFEESMNNMILVNNKYPPAPIVRLYDWLLHNSTDPTLTDFTPELLNEVYTQAPVDAFNRKEMIRNDTQLMYFNQAKDLLESFRRGKLLTHQVFNVEKLAKVFAIIDLFGYHHSTAYSNIRFYYNPFTSLLEPIGRDEKFIFDVTYLEGQSKKMKILPSVEPEYVDYTVYQRWYDTIFNDKVFVRYYIKALEEISDKSFLDKLFEKTDKEYEEKLHILYRSYPAYRFKGKAILYRNQEYIKKLINPVEAIQPYYKGIDRNNKIITLEIGNIHSLPVEILGLSYKDIIFPMVRKEVILEPRSNVELLDFKSVEFKIPQGVALTSNDMKHFKVEYRIYGASQVKERPVYPWSYYDEDFAKTDLVRHKPNISEFNFLDVQQSEKTITLKKGHWNVSKSLIIPEGYTVICRKGTQIVLSHSAAILSYSPFEFIGTDEEPIVIRSKDSTGQGIIFLKTKKRSIFENVIFDNLNAPSQGNWKLSGSITFYESPFTLYHSRIIRDRSQAGLHSVRTEFTIDGSSFSQASSNALTVEFSKGKISKTEFYNTGKDGIHISGSSLEAEDILMDKVSGRAINAEEASEADIKDLEIDKAYTAVESCDRSNVNIEKIKIAECNNLFVVYHKNPEFGPAAISIKSFEPKAFNGRYILEEQSVLTIDGKELKANEQKVSKAVDDIKIF